MNRRSFLVILFFFLSFLIVAPSVFAQCNTPAGAESQTRYAANKLYYCGGGSWHEVPGSSAGGTGAGCVVGSVYVPGGQNHTFYSAAVNPNCAAVSQSRTCNNGVLSGGPSYQYPSCITGTPAAYYLTTSTYNGSTAGTACDPGYNVCEYTTTTKFTTTGYLHGSKGDPSPWTKYGYVVSDGGNNCTNWSSTSGDGGAVRFHSHGVEMSMHGGSMCNSTYAVWCCENTGPSDTTPDAFSFNDVTNATTSTLTTPSPATVTISGINASTSVSVSGDGSPQISINGGGWVTSGSITNGQTLAVRLTSSASASTAHNATINVGGVTDSWSVTTAAAADTTPDPFTFGDVTGSSTGEWISNGGANPTITGINAPTPVSISGQGTPQIRVVGVGSWVTSTTVTNGQHLATRLLTATTGGTTYTATIDVGGVTDNWSVTTGCDSGGVIVADICWYLGSSNQTCSTVCSARGGYNALTLSYAGSGGTNMQCRSVLDALGAGTTGSVPGTNALAYGCAYNSSLGTRVRGTTATTAASSAAGIQRACACNGT